eukprot:Gb_31425 [translate_table: standard]
MDLLKTSESADTPSALWESSPENSSSFDKSCGSKLLDASSSGMMFEEDICKSSFDSSSEEDNECMLCDSEPVEVTGHDASRDKILKELDMAHTREQSADDTGTKLGIEIDEGNSEHDWHGVSTVDMCFRLVLLNISGQETEEFNNEFDEKHNPE